ncbi:MAG: dihydroorotase, partial [Pseudomonadota bacterium]
MSQALPQQTLFTNARLLDPATGTDEVGSLLIEGSRIVDFGAALFREGAPALADVIDCQGNCLAPGLVDMRASLGEPGDEHKETIETAASSAIAGGITSLACLPNTRPPVDDVPALEFIARRAREAKAVKIHSYACATRGAEGQKLTEMGLLAEAGAIGFTDGDRAIADSQTMVRALQYANSFDRVVVQHPEDPSLAGNGHMNNGELAFRLGLSGIPSEAEVILLERDLRLVAMTGARYHAAHLSTGAAVNAVRTAKANGLPVTCDTAPAYFLMTETDVGNYRTFAKLSPPLRTEDD